MWFEIIYWLDDADDIYLCICMNDCKGGGRLEKGWGGGSVWFATIYSGCIYIYVYTEREMSGVVKYTGDVSCADADDDRWVNGGVPPQPLGG